MCQIIHKIADYSLPFPLLSSTCIVNEDGWGIMMYNPDSKKMDTFKLYDGPNDPEEIFELLKDFHDYECFLHFRFRTKGPVNSEACHPFVIYDKFDHQVAMMHNGTLMGFGSQDKVDSLDFGEQIIAPLYDKFLKSGVQKPLLDPFFKQIVTKFTDVGSKIVLMDNSDTYSIIRPEQGEMYTDDNNGDPKEFWVSNKYSFNQYYRKGGTSTAGRGFSPTSKTTTTTTVTISGSNGSTDPHSQWDFDNDKWKEDGAKRTAEKQKEVGKVPERVKYPVYHKDILGLDGIDELLDMTIDDISDLVDIEPEHAKLFIKDLLHEIWTLNWSDDHAEDGEEYVTPDQEPTLTSADVH